ncbi:hypothetical protein [Aquirufa nivalisilvae]|uniref:hypothetical protein n=1 Tax=Aquirufa nivalisilvae TaxID=2516557 RepID=UPI0022A922FC|nr:hypothetical protein [Aquirufa nivalisilvae]MCZ2480608.1 outer membrane lipoprotein-sorting protein [Aquirufa nivalisilvae]
MKILLTISLFICTLFQVIGQDAQKTIQALQQKWSLVKDYAVDLNIKSNIPLIKILPVNATLYFKQKDQFHLKSKGIAILPKKGFGDLAQLLAHQDQFNAISTGKELIKNKETEIITLLPNGDSEDVILAKLWIDKSNNLVLKSQITSRRNGTVSADYVYGSEAKWGLPEQLIFTVDVKKFKVPKGVVVDINKTQTVDTQKQVAKTGDITVKFSNYKINQGIASTIFKN